MWPCLLARYRVGYWETLGIFLLRFVRCSSQGWGLLRARNVTLPGELLSARDHLRRALWTTFDAEGLRIILAYLAWMPVRLTAKQAFPRCTRKRLMVGRRQFLSLVSASALAPFAAAVSRAQRPASTPVRRLIFVHGRDQQGMDPVVLKSRWLAALQRGSASLHRQLPPSVDVSFPFYGDVLYKYASAPDIPLTTKDIQARGDANVDYKFLEFEAAVADQLRKGAGISDDAVDAEYGNEPAPRGPENWKWVQALVRVLDKHGGGATGDFIETFMRDVYLYSYRGGVRNEIDAIVACLLYRRARCSCRPFARISSRIQYFADRPTPATHPPPNDSRMPACDPRYPQPICPDSFSAPAGEFVEQCV